MPNSEPSPQSPLAAIRDKERTLAQDIRTAQDHATSAVAEARARAEAIKAQAERDGMQQAEALYQNGLARAREQAKQTSAEGEEQANKLREAGLRNVQKAVDHIVRFVLPKSQ